MGWIHNINPNTGALTPVPGAPFSVGIVTPSVIAVHPTGRFLYVAQSGSPSIAAFAIDSSTGALSPIAGSPFPAGIGATSVAVDPAGEFAYAAGFVSNSVLAYSIDPNTGALSPVPGSPFAAASPPISTTVDPTDRFVYGAGSGNISAYTINLTTGALSPLPGSPFGTDINSLFLTIDPTGRFAYADAGSEDISAFTIDREDGFLTPILGSPYVAGVSPSAITIDPTGRFAYVPIFDENDLAAFAIDSETGALTSIGKFPTGTQPITAATDPSGRFLYAANSGSNNISGYSIDPATGSLNPIGAFPAATNPLFIAAVSEINGCSISVVPDVWNAAAAGGSGTVGVKTGVGCPWTAVSQAPWLTVSPTDGSSSGVLSIGAAANSDKVSRSGTINVSGQLLTVNQAPSCSYSLAFNSGSLPSSGGSATATLTTQPGCSWSASTNVSWLHVIAPLSGSGTAIISLTADANSGAPRTGALSAGAATVAVSQGGSSQTSSFCGATNITNVVSFSPGPILADFIDPDLYYQTSTLSNHSGQPIAGPIYLVFGGLPNPPNTSPQNGVDFATLTYCLSASGTDKVLITPSGLAVGQSITQTINFVSVLGYGSSRLNYEPIIISGIPSK